MLFINNVSVNLGWEHTLSSVKRIPLYTVNHLYTILELSDYCLKFFAEMMLVIDNS